MRYLIFGLSLFLALPAWAASVEGAPPPLPAVGDAPPPLPAENAVKKQLPQPQPDIRVINKDDATLFDWVVEKEEYEMVVTDDKETWVTFWGIWKGTLKSSGKVYQIPFHTTARFIDGKIVAEYGYWNNSEIVTDMLKQPETPKTDAEKPTE